MTGWYIPPQWVALAAEELRGTVMIVGASDTGKSTLARYLFRELCTRGRLVAYVDTDVGQSTLGLPTTMSLGLARECGDARFPPRGPSAAFFVGATTPRGHMLPVLVGAHRLQHRAVDAGADVIIVDTTGLVDKSQGGQALKQWKIELLAPATVVAFHRSSELEPILWPLRRAGRVRCVELSVSPHVLVRSREARIAHRRARLGAYFDGAQTWRVPLRRMSAYGMERMVPGALMAFQDEAGYCLGLGAVEEVRHLDASCAVRSPVTSLQGVASVRFGTARWDLAARREG